MSPADGVPVTEGFIASGGIAIGRPVSDQPRSGQVHVEEREARGLRLFVNCPHLDMERGLVEYPPGDPLGPYTHTLSKVDAGEKVWVMAIALGRFTFVGHHEVASPLKIEVVYGNHRDKTRIQVFKLLSQDTSNVEIRGLAGSYADFDSALSFPWRSDVCPILSLRIYQTGTLFGTRLPFALNPAGFRNIRGQHSMELPFEIQCPRKITQDVMFTDPKTNALFGSIRMAVDFKQMELGVLRKGGSEMFSALMRPDSDALVMEEDEEAAWYMSE